MADPADHPTIVALQARVRALDERCRYFHLTRCECGAPCFQQPCSICGFYPMGDYAKQAARVAGKGTRERFVDSVEDHPNIGVWFVMGRYVGTVAWKQDPDFRVEIEALTESIAAQVEPPWPSAAEIYDIFAAPKA